MKINFILTKMTLDSYYVSREKVRIFPQVALSSWIKSPKTSQNYVVRNKSEKGRKHELKIEKRLIYESLELN